MKKKILLLTASYGTGHVTASKSIGKALAELYPDEIQTMTVDFLKTADSKHPSHFFEKSYNFTMEYPVLWHLIFKLSNGRLAHFYFSHIFPSFYKEMEKIFAQENPDLCITTHPYWNFLLDKYNNNTDNRKKYICVVTDSTLIHCTWISPEVDYYMVPDEDTKEAIADYGIDRNKLFVKGFPVDPGFAKEISRDAFLKEQGLDPKQTTILMVIGLGDTGKFLKLVDYLSKKDTNNFQLIVITGKYKNIYDELIKKSFRASLKIVGWTDRMRDFIKSSDLIISKGGGAIVMETLSAGKPVLVPVFTPGQELGNARLLKKYGYGFVEQDFNKITGILEEVISKPGMISGMKDRIKEYSKPDAAREIAKFAYNIVSK